MANSSTRDIPIVTYVLLQTTQGPSLLCDVIVFMYFIRHWKKEVLSAPHNHVILCLLIASFIQKLTDVVFYLYYLRWGTVLLPTDTFCATWVWFNYSFFGLSLHYLVWCCIERHLFIFHSHMMKNRVCLILLHYIPLLVCSTYIPFFYFGYVFFPDFCANEWDYTLAYCGEPCYAYSSPFVGTFDWLFNLGVAIVIVIVTNLVFFFRVVWHKVRRQHRIEWARQRRLIIQLVFVSSLFLILVSPQIIVGCIQILWEPTFLSDVQNDYFYYIACFANQFLPFIIVSSLPKLKEEMKQCKNWICRRCGGRFRIQPVPRMTIVGNATCITAENVIETIT